MLNLRPWAEEDRDESMQEGESSTLQAWPDGGVEQATRSFQGWEDINQSGNNRLKKSSLTEWCACAARMAWLICCLSF